MKLKEKVDFFKAEDGFHTSKELLKLYSAGCCYSRVHSFHTSKELLKQDLTWLDEDVTASFHTSKELLKPFSTFTLGRLLQMFPYL